MKKYSAIILALFLLAGCNNIESKATPEEIFDKEIKSVYSEAEKDNLCPLDIISQEIVEDIVTRTFEGYDIYTRYDIISEGIITDKGNRKRGGYKLPVEISANMDENSLKQLMGKINSIENKTGIADLEITEDGGNFKFKCKIIFYGYDIEKQEKEKTVSKSNIQLIDGDTKEAEKIDLRDFDLFLILRPNISDASAIGFEFRGKDGSTMSDYYDSNSKEELNIVLTSGGNKYYCEYSIGGKDSVKEELQVKGKDIVFDILSCKTAGTEDKVGVSLKVNNKTEKQLSIRVYDDKDSRVKFIDKIGKVEIVK